MLYAWTQIAAPCSVVVSIDLPGGRNGGGQSVHERELFASFARREQQLHCLLETLQTPRPSTRLKEIVDGRPVDLLFVDGDHTYDGVTTDLALYGPMVAPDGIIALHDICLLPDEWDPGPESACSGTSSRRVRRRPPRDRRPVGRRDP